MLRALQSRAGPAVVAACAVAMPAVMWSHGSFASTAGLPAAADREAIANSRPNPALNPNEFRSFKLAHKEQLTHDTARYTFALPRASDELGLTIASCLVVQAEIDGKALVRPYTPTSPTTTRGTFDLIVKSYPEGKISKWLSSVPIGGAVPFKGPFSKFEYVPNTWDAVGLIAGGTGITPMYQLIESILANPRDKTEIRLLYASRTPADIILKTQLDALTVTHPNFKVIYLVDKPSDDWHGVVGYITPEMVTSFFPPPQTEAGRFKIMVCGPPGMMKTVSGEKKSPSEQGELTGLLKDLHYTPEQVFKY